MTNNRVPGFKHRPSKLEGAVRRLERVTGKLYTGPQLIKQGYTAAYRSMTMRIGEMVIYYREEDAGMYNFECVIREPPWKIQPEPRSA